MRSKTSPDITPTTALNHVLSVTGCGGTLNGEAVCVLAKVLRMVAEPPVVIRSLVVEVVAAGPEVEVASDVIDT